MRSIINELWHGNIIPQEDSRNNTKEMKELLSYMPLLFSLQRLMTKIL